MMEKKSSVENQKNTNIVKKGNESNPSLTINVGTSKLSITEEAIKTRV
jgi:hypothetical protein